MNLKDTIALHKKTNIFSVKILLSSIVFKFKICLCFGNSVCGYVCVPVLFANFSVLIVSIELIIFNMHVPALNYVSFILTYANHWSSHWLLLDIPKRDKISFNCIEYLWRWKTIAKFQSIGKGARYKGNDFLRHAVSMSNGTFKHSKYKQRQHISILRKNKKNIVRTVIVRRLSKSFAIIRYKFLLKWEKTMSIIYKFPLAIRDMAKNEN